MYTLIVLCLALMLGTVGNAILRERSMARDLDGRGNAAPEAALLTCERLTRSALFHSAEEIAGRCELLAYEHAKALVERGDYREAARHINRIVENDVVTGVEAAARALAARIPDDHLASISALIRGSQFDKALAEVAVAQRLYEQHPHVGPRLQILRVEAQLGLARRHLDDGDPLSTLRDVAALDPDGSLRARTEALTLVEQALSHAADHYGGLGDTGGLFRHFAKAQEAVAAQPYVARRVEQLVSAQAEQVFGVTGLGPVIIHAPPAMRGAAVGGGEAKLVMRNANAYSIEARLVGPEQRRVTIRGGSSESLKLKTGEYVQLVHPRGPGPRPLLGVILVDGTHEQQFGVVAGVRPGRS